MLTVFYSHLTACMQGNKDVLLLYFPLNGFDLENILC